MLKSFFLLSALGGAIAASSSPQQQQQPHHIRNRRLVGSIIRNHDGDLPVSSRARLSSMPMKWKTPSHIAQRQQREHSLLLTTDGHPTTTTTTSPWIVSPVDYGADPTGVSDSTQAFKEALKVFLARNTSGHTDESGTVDLGGALFDMEGGDYLVSLPLTIPSNYSNFQIAHGTLRASSSFPPSHYLIEIGTPNSDCVNWGNSCNEDGSIEDVFLDASQVAAGCIQFNSVIGFNAGPDIYCLNFTTNGVDMEGGHEVVLHETWVASCWYTPPAACWLNASALGNTTGIFVNGNDHYVSDTIAFGGKIGLMIMGAANMVTNVHTWNTQSGSVPDAIGIGTTVWQNRFVGCYLDFVPFVCQGCAVTSFTNGFFLGGAQILLKPHPNSYPVRGVYIAGNEWSSLGDGQQTVIALPPQEGYPSYSSIEDVTITGSLVDNPAAIISSTVSSITITNSTSPWVADFSSLMLFDVVNSNSTTPIRTVSFSSILLSDATTTLGNLYALAPVGGKVTVMSTSPTHRATVTITVDQSIRRSS